MVQIALCILWIHIWPSKSLCIQRLICTVTFPVSTGLGLRAYRRAVLKRDFVYLWSLVSVAGASLAGHGQKHWNDCCARAVCCQRDARAAPAFHLVLVVVSYIPGTLHQRRDLTPITLIDDYGFHFVYRMSGIPRCLSLPCNPRVPICINVSLYSSLTCKAGAASAPWPHRRHLLQ